ncbi:hypothetical protein H4582DRAFT_1973013, partial [Lactarius indigo]
GFTLDHTLFKRKHDDTRLPNEVNAAEWAYSALLADIGWLVSRWKGRVPHECELNALSMFTRTIAVQGIGWAECALRASAKCRRECHPAIVRPWLARKLLRNDQGTALHDGSIY